MATSKFTQGTTLKTRNGAKAVVMYVSNEKIVANVYPTNKMGLPTQMTFKTDGTKYGPEYPTIYDLMVA